MGMESEWFDEMMDTSIYSEESRSGLVEDDEISALEAAFMRGWDEAA